MKLKIKKFINCEASQHNDMMKSSTALLLKSSFKRSRFYMSQIENMRINEIKSLVRN